MDQSHVAFITTDKKLNFFIRFQAAKELQELYSLDIPVLVDLLDNKLSNSYAANPERFYVLRDGVVVLAGDQGPLMYDLGSLEKWIANYVNSEI